MLFNQLFAIPTEDTLSYLHSVFSASPIDIDISSFKVELITSLDEIVPEPDRVYQAQVTEAKVWYDSGLQMSSFLLSLHSPDLLTRALELAQQGVAREFYDAYMPHMTVIQGMPPLSSNYRRFVLSIANLFGSNPTPLEFTNEFVVATDLQVPPNADYYDAKIKEMSDYLVVNKQ
jgi:hypothetical protein